MNGDLKFPCLAKGNIKRKWDSIDSFGRDMVTFSLNTIYKVRSSLLEKTVAFGTTTIPYQEFHVYYLHIYIKEIKNR